MQNATNHADTIAIGYQNNIITQKKKTNGII